MSSVPAIVSALVFLVVAAVEWRRLVVVARIALGAGFALALAAMRHPGESVEALLRHTDSGVAQLAHAARPLGLAAVVLSLAALLVRLRVGD